MSGTGPGIGTIIAFLLIGHFSDAHQAAAAHSFDPIVIVAGMVPFVAMILVLLLVRNNRATEEGVGPPDLMQFTRSFSFLYFPLVSAIAKSDTLSPDTSKGLADAQLGAGY